MGFSRQEYWSGVLQANLLIFPRVSGGQFRGGQPRRRAGGSRHAVFSPCARGSKLTAEGPLASSAQSLNPGHRHGQAATSNWHQLGGEERGHSVVSVSDGQVFGHWTEETERAGSNGQREKMGWLTGLLEGKCTGQPATFFAITSVHKNHACRGGAS